MKFHIGPIPDNPGFNPDDSWQRLDEPGPKTFIWVAIPAGIFVTTAFFILWFSLTDLAVNDILYWYFYENTFLSIMMILIGLIIVHEIIHAVFHPGYGISSKTIFGLWPSKGVFFAFWDDEWHRSRAIGCIISPFLVLTVLPLLVSFLPYTFVPWLNDTVKAMFCVVSLTNAFFSCADLIGARMFVLQIPVNGILRNKGFHTYWRLDG